MSYVERRAIRATLRRTRGPIVIGLTLIPLLAACGGGTVELSSRVDELRAEQQRRQAELNRIELQIRAAQLEQQRQQC